MGQCNYSTRVLARWHEGDFRGGCPLGITFRSSYGITHESPAPYYHSDDLLDIYKLHSKGPKPKGAIPVHQ